MTQTPNGAEAQRIVDDLEEDIVDVDKASQEQPDDEATDQQEDGQQDGQDGQQDGRAEDVSGGVPGSPEPTD